MGDNPQATNVSLPTMRWWTERKRRRQAARAARARGGGAPPGSNGRGGTRRLARALALPVRKSLGLAHRVAEEAYRQSVASSFARRGFIVLYDRHFLLDHWHAAVGPGPEARSLKRRVHGFLLQRVLREPDLVICLDAPGEVVWRRKRELTPEILERRRAQYRELAAHVRHFALVDADRPLERVLGDVEDRIQRFRSEVGDGKN
jgi:hypothetical protein